MFLYFPGSIHHTFRYKTQKCYGKQLIHLVDRFFYFLRSGILGIVLVHGGYSRINGRIHLVWGNLIFKSHTILDS